MNSIEEQTRQFPVVLTIRGEQQFEDIEPDATELMTEGTLELGEDGVIRLSYRETELTGMEGTVTTFHIRKGQVTLERSGAVSSQMVFEEGRQHTSLYETPMGEMPVDIQTSFLRHDLTERGGMLMLRYSIAIANTATGRNTVKIRVRRKRT